MAETHSPTCFQQFDVQSELIDLDRLYTDFSHDMDVLEGLAAGQQGHTAQGGGSNSGRTGPSQSGEEPDPTAKRRRRRNDAANKAIAISALEADVAAAREKLQRLEQENQVLLHLPCPWRHTLPF